MAYDGKLADRIRKALTGQKELTEKKMFGGIAFMLHSNMCCGVLKDDLVVRVSPERYEKALSQPHARPMDFTGRPLKGFVFIGPGGCRTDKALAKWVKQATDFVMTLPRKQRQKRTQKGKNR
ncbi:TfoX family protein [bacterium]|nr:MAG: TfoX family protein [bacterium]